MSSTLKIPEAELVALLKQQSSKGFKILYQNYAGTLYGVILRILHKEDVSQDVLQEAFVKIWKNIGAYDRSKGTLFTWMLNITRNLAIDKSRTNAFKFSNTAQDIAEAGHSVDAQYNYSGNTDFIGIPEMVEKLKPEHKAIIDLLYFQGYTQAEAAEELNIPLGTVKTRVKSAIGFLKTLI